MKTFERRRPKSGRTPSRCALDDLVDLASSCY